MNDATHDHSRVSPEGRSIGLKMAGIADRAAAELAAEGVADERCKSCAFRAGTVPNGCAQTQADVLKCLVEQVPFRCHQADRNNAVCHGWLLARCEIVKAEEVRGPMPIINCPWEFSKTDENATANSTESK